MVSKQPKILVKVTAYHFTTPFIKKGSIIGVRDYVTTLVANKTIIHKS